MILAKAISGLMGTTLVAGALVLHEGIISVSVREKGKDGSHVRLYVPGALVSAGVALAPEEHLRRATQEARQYLPAIRAGVEQLAKCPDTVLVEVQERDERVRIEKRGGRLLIDVDSPREEVHLGVPITTVISIIREIEAAGPGN